MSQQIKRYTVIGNDSELFEVKDGDVCMLADVAPYINVENFNSVQQMQAEIRSLVAEFCDLYDGDLSNAAISLLLTKLRELSDMQ